ncbi:MAG: hypothetical protein AMJ90_04535 [candidate division Zixibacteria bacterium SM23_73_2]|nr:MAG: hypothetical protein AMJ90_04535 [candidate division Zixibacteria bacterium SM23_73_2]
MELKKRFIFGLIISAIFLYLAVHKVDLVELWRALKDAEYLWVLPNMALMMFSYWLRAYRWKFMVNPIKKLSLNRLFSATIIGFMANNVLPVRLGEVVRAYSLGSKAEISKTASFATIVVERVFDGFSLLLILWITLLFAPFPEIVKKAGNLTLVLNVILLLVLIFLEIKTKPTLSFFEKILKLFPRPVSSKASELLYKFTTGLKIFRDLPNMLWIIFLSLMVWVIVGTSNYFIFLSFGFTPPFYASFILLVIVALGVMLPSSPGFIGTFQYACILALGIFGIEKSVAFSFSVVLWISQYLPVTALGFYYLKREHLSLKEVREEKRDTPKEHGGSSKV